MTDQGYHLGRAMEAECVHLRSIYYIWYYKLAIMLLEAMSVIAYHCFPPSDKVKAEL